MGIKVRILDGATQITLLNRLTPAQRSTAIVMCRQLLAELEEANQGPVTWSSSTGPNIVFRSGIMYVDDRAQRPIAVARWQSDSDPDKSYACTHWFDTVTGEHRTSCNCRGWAVKKAGRDRSCCHTDDMQDIARCYKTRVDIVRIETPEQAVQYVPKVEDTRELRSIWID